MSDRPLTTLADDAFRFTVLPDDLYADHHRSIMDEMTERVTKMVAEGKIVRLTLSGETVGIVGPKGTPVPLEWRHLTLGRMQF